MTRFSLPHQSQQLHQRRYAVCQIIPENWRRSAFRLQHLRVQNNRENQHGFGTDRFTPTQHAETPQNVPENAHFSHETGVLVELLQQRQKEGRAGNCGGKRGQKRGIQQAQLGGQLGDDSRGNRVEEEMIILEEGGVEMAAKRPNGLFSTRIDDFREHDLQSR